MEKSKVHSMIIIGAGPAGLTAALYAARANLEPLVIAGSLPGGQLMLTTMVENYPGFPEGIMGPQLMQNFIDQATRFGAKMILNDVTKVDFSQRPFKIFTSKEEYLTECVIIGTGASAKMLGLENELRLVGRGVSTCATCDGFFFKDKKVAIVGGGDSAMEEATFLTKFASEVHIFHRRDSFRASKVMQDRAFANKKIMIHWNTQIRDVHGENNVTGLKIENTATGEVKDEDFDGLFVAIGHVPNTKMFEGQLDLLETGYIKNNERTRTSVVGVFTCGDVNDFLYRQAITAAGMGCAAAMDAEKWLEEQKHA